jgi:hypothetical protein
MRFKKAAQLGNGHGVLAKSGGHHCPIEGLRSRPETLSALRKSKIR